MLGLLRKLVFEILHQFPASRFAESMRRINRLARLMTIVQHKAATRGRQRGKPHHKFA